MRISQTRTAAAALAALLIGGCGQPAPEAFREPNRAVQPVESNVQALQAWAGSKARAVVLVHIDTIDDMAVFPQSLAESMKNAADHLARGNVAVIDRIAPLIEKGGTVNLGYGAGLYRRVVWVVPAAGSVADTPVENFRSVLVARRGYAASDLVDLQTSGRSITGTIGGVPLTVTTLEDLDIGDERAIIDIDLGWFVALQGQDPSYRPGTASLLNVLRVIGRKRIPAVYVTITRNSPRQSVPLDIRYYADVIRDALEDPALVIGPTPPLYDGMIQAESALVERRYGEAQALYLDLTAQRDDMAGLFFSLGLVDGFLDDAQQSRDALLRAYRLDQGYLPAFFQVARVLAGMGLVETGTYLLDTPDLGHIVPEIEIESQKGFFYLAAGRPYDAITWLERVAGVRPDDFAVRTVLAQQYREIGDAEKETRTLEELLSIDTQRVERDMPWVYKRLGELAEQAGMRERAAQMYERFLELSPDDDDAPRMRRLIGRG
jgi:tetratricopeptide (TPR) repeat protein